MRIIGNLEDLDIIEHPDGRVVFIGNMDIDCDGSGGNPDNDRYFQPETTLKRNGKSLNAYNEPFIVVPPLIIAKVTGVVLGCYATVEDMLTYASGEAVVGDVGPTFKDGEGSPALAVQIGVDPNPRTGGQTQRRFRYTIYPGKAAKINGVQYELQAWKPKKR